MEEEKMSLLGKICLTLFGLVLVAIFTFAFIWIFTDNVKFMAAMLFSLASGGGVILFYLFYTLCKNE